MVTSGNMSKEHRPSGGVTDLITPQLKQDTYTTGRGGTGNMAKNDPNHPELARAAQDVAAPVHREHDSAVHYGRGGAANITKPTEEEARQAQSTSERSSGEHHDSDAKRLADKGKDLLGKIGLGTKK
jgi:hypothetical protein